MKRKPDLPDKLFQKSFTDFAPLPSEKVWKGLEERLLEKQAVEQSTVRDKKKLLLSMLVLLLGSMICWAYLDYSPKKDRNVIQSSSPIKLNDNSIENLDRNIIDSSRNYNIKQRVNSTIKNAVAGIQEKKSVVAPASSVVLKSNNNQVSGSPKINDINELPIEENDELSKKIIRDVPLKLAIKNVTQFEAINQNVSLKIINPTAPNFLSRLRIAPCFSKSKFDRKIKRNTSVTGSSNETEAFFNQHESSAKGWSYGVKLGLDLKNNWNLESGLNIHQFQMQTEQTIPAIFKNNAPLDAIVFTSFNVNTVEFKLTEVAGFEPGDLVALNGKVNQEIRWLSVPLMVGYRINKGRMGLQMSSGLSANFFLDDKLELNRSQLEVSTFEHTYSESSGKSFLAYRGELNMHCRAKPKLSVFLGVYHERALSPANQQKAVLFFPNMTGWQVGLEKGF